MGSAIAFGMELCKLVVMVIILYYVCEALGIPEIPKKVCQLMILLYAILAAMSSVAASETRARIDKPLPDIYKPPSIMAPERR